MTKLTWIQGDPVTALAELNKGGAILVAREFLITRGLGAGDTIELKHEGKPFTFRIVGVVTSPGLDIVSKYFDVGEEYVDQAINAVMGSRADMVEKFGNDNINLIQIAMKEGTDETKAMNEVRGLVGSGIIGAGSGRGIKAEIKQFIGGSLLVSSVVAVGALLVACFGVANLIVAGIQARQYEFGVLRAVGAQKGLLGRLVIGEALLIAVTACLLGTALGTQASWAEQRIYEIIIGLVLHVRPPVIPVLAGWAAVTLITLAAAAPAAWRLMGKRPRELLGAVRG